MVVVVAVVAGDAAVDGDDADAVAVTTGKPITNSNNSTSSINSSRNSSNVNNSNNSTNSNKISN